jgi:hypothetical protein
LETANKQVAIKSRKGSAIEELTSMIGLQEAKAVVQQALDFYKAQKIFRDKGFLTERPAMHMIFVLGNHLARRTTVTRLFAQIMKDKIYYPSATYTKSDALILWCNICWGGTAQNC